MQKSDWIYNSLPKILKYYQNLLYHRRVLEPLPTRARGSSYPIAESLKKACTVQKILYRISESSGSVFRAKVSFLLEKNRSSKSVVTQRNTICMVIPRVPFSTLCKKAKNRTFGHVLKNLLFTHFNSSSWNTKNPLVLEIFSIFSKKVIKKIRFL